MYYHFCVLTVICALDGCLKSCNFKMLVTSPHVSSICNSLLDKTQKNPKSVVWTFIAGVSEVTFRNWHKQVTMCMWIRTIHDTDVLFQNSW